VYYEGEKQWTMVKRFLIETTTIGQRFKCITEHPDSKLYFVSLEEDPVVEFGYMSNRQKVSEVFQPAEFIEVKGWKAIGNKLVDKKLISIQAQLNEEEADIEAEAEEEAEEKVVPKAPTKKAVQADLFSAPIKSKETKPAPKKTVQQPAKKQAPKKSVSKGGAKKKVKDGKGKKSKDGGYLKMGDIIEFDV